MNAKTIEALDIMIENGMSKIKAFRLIGLTRPEARVYRRLEERRSFDSRNRRFVKVTPWRCPGCGGLINISFCMECE